MLAWLSLQSMVVVARLGRGPGDCFIQSSCSYLARAGQRPGERAEAAQSFAFDARADKCGGDFPVSPGHLVGKLRTAERTWQGASLPVRVRRGWGGGGGGGVGVLRRGSSVGLGPMAPRRHLAPKEKNANPRPAELDTSRASPPGLCLDPTLSRVPHRAGLHAASIARS